MPAFQDLTKLDPVPEVTDLHGEENTPGTSSPLDIRTHCHLVL